MTGRRRPKENSSSPHELSWVELRGTWKSTEEGRGRRRHSRAVPCVGGGTSGRKKAAQQVSGGGRTSPLFSFIEYCVCVPLLFFYGTHRHTDREAPFKVMAAARWLVQAQLNLPATHSNVPDPPPLLLFYLASSSSIIITLPVRVLALFGAQWQNRFIPTLYQNTLQEE